MSNAEIKNKKPFHIVYVPEIFTNRVYFYTKDYETDKLAEEACYEHRGPSTREICYDWQNRGWYYYLRK